MTRRAEHPNSFSSFRSAFLKVGDLIGTQFRLGKPYRRRVRNHSCAVDEIKPIDTGNHTSLDGIHFVAIFPFEKISPRSTITMELAGHLPACKELRSRKQVSYTHFHFTNDCRKFLCRTSECAYKRHDAGWDHSTGCIPDCSACRCCI